MDTQDLTKTCLKSMTQKTRDDGNKFYCFSDDAPDWMTDMAHEAHGDFMPDDHRYEFIHDALVALADNDDTDEARESIESDCYTSDLLAWLSSNLNRLGYVDQSIQEMGKCDSLANDLMGGQLVEKLEVFDAVLSFLENKAEELDETA